MMSHYVISFSHNLDLDPNVNILWTQPWMGNCVSLRATSHTKLRAHDHCTSSTLIARKGGAQSKFASHHAWGTHEASECKMFVKFGFLHGIKWIMFHGHLDYFQKPSLEGRPNTKPRDHNTPKSPNRKFTIINHMCEDPTEIEIHRNSNRLRARTHTASHCTRGPMTTLHDSGSALGRPLDTFFWGLTLSWSHMQIPSQNYKYSSWHHFHYSQVNWWSSFTCQRSLTP